MNTTWLSSFQRVHYWRFHCIYDQYLAVIISTASSVYVTNRASLHMDTLLSPPSLLVIIPPHPFPLGWFQMSSYPCFFTVHVAMCTCTLRLNEALRLDATTD